MPTRLPSQWRESQADEDGLVRNRARPFFFLALHPVFRRMRFLSTGGGIELKAGAGCSGMRGPFIRRMSINHRESEMGLLPSIRDGQPDDKTWWKTIMLSIAPRLAITPNLLAGDIDAANWFHPDRAARGGCHHLDSGGISSAGSS